MIDPELIGDAEVYTGGFPVRYGNRMGGVFDLRTLDADVAPHTALGLSVFNAMARSSGVLEGPDLDWLAMARIGTLKPFVRAFAENAGSPSYSDVYARAGYGAPDRLRLTANFLWSRDELSISRDSQGEHANLESRNSYLWVRADHDFDNGIEASLLLGESSIDGFREGSVDNPGISTGVVADRRSSEYLDARGNVAWQINPRNWVEGGFEWTKEDAVYHYASQASYTPAVADLFSRDAELARAIELTPTRERLSFFASHRWQIRDNLVSELGLRGQRTVTDGTTTENWQSRSARQPALAVQSFDQRARAHWGRFGRPTKSTNSRSRTAHCLPRGAALDQRSSASTTA
jgi:hypothetical protein